MVSEHIGNMDVVQECVHANSKDIMNPTWRTICEGFSKQSVSNAESALMSCRHREQRHAWFYASVNASTFHELVGIALWIRVPLMSLCMYGLFQVVKIITIFLFVKGPVIQWQWQWQWQWICFHCHVIHIWKIHKIIYTRIHPRCNHLAQKKKKNKKNNSAVCTLFRLIIVS